MRRLLIILAVLVALFSLVRHFPLAWAGASLPAEVGTLSGTIWNGQASQVPLLGSVAVKGGMGHVKLETLPGDVTFSGDVSLNGVKDLILSMPVSHLPMGDARLANLAGRVSLNIKEARLKDGACTFASGTASTNVLSSNRARFDWAGPDLFGPVDCVDGALRVRLSGQSEQETVSATIMTALDGVYQSDILVETADPAAQNALVLFGFAAGQEGTYRLSEQGRWR